ncbi:isoleucine--tRNA ligase [Mycoplasmopsis bovirhinis]|uniref:isoleucine--tRNA ligase n=1 Tax=Mycoplasmopsis bovirhinis TaxID=29553 RepID=UPI000BB9C114|nr:isoleucine--tRNA ligase [Mycoplasmopsis bovirhinis]BBA22092.1 isoleucine--tRNA ligase [Mycoplasmopsis bovirhinis]
MDYKKTLNMPQTNFEMRANLASKEASYRTFWLESKIYQKAILKNKNNEKFILHDGPPYANGDIHIGHALNKILKDIIVRYKTIRGFYSPFVLGWDTHGLPIEHKMLTDAKITQKDLNVLTLRKRAAEYAKEQIKRQKEQFSLLQIFTDMDRTYVTLDKDYEVAQLKVLKKLALDGLVYKALKPVYWSPSSQSALAESEVEYHNIVSPSIFVAFKVIKSKFEKVLINDNLIIWTTTPWTLIANAGVALGENILYVRVKVKDQYYIIAHELVENVANTIGWETFEIVATFLGKEISTISYQTPILDNSAPVVLGHHVTTESGSGLVHIAPLFGEDDFSIGKKYQLNMIMHISDKGYIYNTNTEFDGLFYDDANKLISQFLGDKLLNFKRFKHSYPHDWRTHKPIIFRGTPQWFVSIDKIKDKILYEIEHNIKTHSPWAKKRLAKMIENRSDWTISRQRSWGVPLIFFYDQNDNPVIDAEIFDYVINLVGKYGTDVWWEKSVDELLPEKYRNLGFKKETDIMDVWFDSGVSSIATDIDSGVSKPPYSVYLEGSDQYRGWFNSSLINSVAYNGFSPYVNLISHGFTLDAKGEKMSKSKGNTVAPLEVVSKRGADILRLWVANSEYTNDVTISDAILDQNTEIYRKIRNTIRFLLGNLNGYKYDQNTIRTGIHLFIKEKLNELKYNVQNAYDQFKFLNVIKLINNYIVELSSFYLSVTKDTLYVHKFNDQERLMTLANMYEIVEFLIVSLAPIMPTTSEEAYSFLPKETKEESVMLERLNAIDKESINYDLIASYQEFFELRSQVNILIENEIKLGHVKRSNELELFLDLEKYIKYQELDFKTLLGVGKLTNAKELKVEKFESLKCLRCWNHFDSSLISNDLCEKCHEALQD